MTNPTVAAVVATQTIPYSKQPGAGNAVQVVGVMTSVNWGRSFSPIGSTYSYSDAFVITPP